MARGETEMAVAVAVGDVADVADQSVLTSRGEADADRGAAPPPDSLTWRSTPGWEWCGIAHAP